jgi:23S rRNA (uracil1939-C5)-methyltransferase
MSRRGSPHRAGHPGSFVHARANAASLPQVPVHALDHEGRGVAKLDGRTLFVDGALPGERARVVEWRQKPTYGFAEAVAIDRESAARVTPRCSHFGTCGGCAMQHMEPRAQVAAKQRVLEDALWHIARVRPALLLPAIHGPTWGYRHRARLTVRDVAKKGGVLVGFHEKRSSFVADMRECPVLPPEVEALLLPLREAVGALSIRDRMPQVEVAVGAGEAGRPHVVLVFRNLLPLTPDDQALLRRFADEHRVQVFLQPKGPETVAPFHPPAPALLEYRLPEHGVRLRFSPTEFTQVNPGVNEMLVRRALGLLDPRPGERIADFFCGLGNFSLPIATRGAQVHGVEGSEALVRRARENAALNDLAARTSFSVADLFTADAASIAALGAFDQWLVDPPRDGAIALVKALPDARGLPLPSTRAPSAADEARPGERLSPPSGHGPHADASTDPEGTPAATSRAESPRTTAGSGQGEGPTAAADAPATDTVPQVVAPRRIVYVSCNPATLARDAAVLVHEKGYVLRAAGVANMFPHTGHVESIACFERAGD